MSSRLTFEESCDRLRSLGLLDHQVVLPTRMPRYDDDVLGVSFFRTFVGPDGPEGDIFDLANLTLPRTFFGRSEIRRTSFENSDLSESSLCWNDFVDVSFIRADLSRSDMRASIYEHVRFNHATLSSSDLRRSTFDNCDFTGAIMVGAVLTRRQGDEANLSSQQRAEIAWTDDDGPEPDGG
jgi:BTB/POZ domain-containing protein KCTD9